MTTSLLIINCLECNCGLIDYWLFEHITREWRGYCSCIYPTFVYVSLKGIGMVGLDMYTWDIKDFHKCWPGSLAKRRLCLGPAGVINCTPLSALSFWVTLFPRKRGYNKRKERAIWVWECQANQNLHDQNSREKGVLGEWVQHIAKTLSFNCVQVKKLKKRAENEN